MAAELASKHNEATTKVWFLVSILQEYFLTRPYMRVALHGETGSKVRLLHRRTLHPAAATAAAVTVGSSPAASVPPRRRPPHAPARSHSNVTHPLIDVDPRLAAACRAVLVRYP